MASKRISDVKLPILTPENYAEWKIKIISLLKARKAFGIVETAPDEEDRKASDFDEVNEEAKTIIYSSLDGKTTQSTGVCENAHDLWVKITSHYEGAKGDIIGLAMSRFMEISKSRGEKMDDFLGRYEIALNNLKATEFVIDITLMLYVLCKSMPQNVKEGIKIWKTINKNGTIEDLISYIRANYREEEMAPDANSAAFFNYKGKSQWKDKKKLPFNSNNKSKFTDYKGKNNNNNNEGGNQDNKKTSLTCTYCKKPGHGWQSCYKLKRKNDEKSNSTNQRANMALERSYQMYQQYLPENGKYTWIIDSGATSHMTHERGVLMNYTEFEKPIEILVGDGEHTDAIGKGWIFFCGINGPKVLKNVLHVPRMAANLFSVKAALQDGFIINFTKDKVIVKQNGEPILAYFDGCLFTIGIKILNEAYSPPGAMTACSMEAWHKRFGHCGTNLIKRLKNNNMVEGLDIGQNPTHCEDCILGKSCRKPHPSRTKITASKNLAILHFDTVDMTIESLNGSRYFILGTEEYSGYKLIDFVSKKSDIKDCVKLMINSVLLNAKRPVACIYSDNGTEFINLDLKEWLLKRGIIHELSSAYNAEQNGRAEASNKSVINGARTALISSGLTKKLWAEACSASVYVLNRLPSNEHPVKTRYELYYGNKSVSNLHEFGEIAIRLIPKFDRGNKMNPVAKRMRFVGYTSRYNTYRLYDEETSKIYIDCNVRFTHEKPTPKIVSAEEYTTIGWENFVRQQPIDDTNNEVMEQNDDNDTENYSTDIEEQSEQNQSPNDTNDINSSQSRIPRPISSARSSMGTTSNDLTINDAIHAEISQRNNQPLQEGRVTRSMTGNLKPIYDPVSLRAPSNLLKTKKTSKKRNVALYSINDEPENVREAEASKDWDKWQIAMKEEIQALEENNTWIIVDKPPNVKPIKTKWIFKLKLRPDGSVERYKARLVAKGYSQIPEIDYKQTFAPVASMTTVRMMLTAAVHYNRQIVQFDIKTAFLYGDLDEELYMECPEYYEAPSGKVCKLMKSLYGLKQAPRQWHKKFDSFLKKFNLMQSTYDKCLYYSDDRKILLTIYVDDGLIVAESKQLALKLIDYLKEFLTVKTMECKAYLGLEIVREDDSIFITQRQYIKKTLEKFGMLDCKASSTPEELGQPNFKDSPKLSDNFPFKELVGCLLYLVTCTRPDIAHGVSVASRTSEPTEMHWSCLKRILRYLKGSISLGIWIRKEKNPELIGYSDADYANDAETRRSTTGFVILWGLTPITWKCQRQSLVSLSTTEAEYISGTEMVKKLIPLKAMMTELKLIENKPVKVYIDNKSTVNIVNNEQGQERTKHIDVRHKWLNEHHDSGNIIVKHISGEEQRADILTKPLLKGKFVTNRNWLLSFLVGILLMILINSTTEGFRFKQTKPVFFRKSELTYIKFLQRYHFRLVIMNPCETYFRNITVKPEINIQLINQCHYMFNKKIRLENCPGKNRDKRENFFSMITNTIGITSPEVAVNTTTNSTQSKSESMIIKENTALISREKRFIPALAVFGLIVISSMTSYSIYKSGVNTSNIKELREAANQEREFLKQGYEVLKAIRENNHDIVERLEELEHRVDYIDKTLKEFPKIISLMNHYERNFHEISKQLREIDHAAEIQQASRAIFKLAMDKEHEGVPFTNLKLELCEEEITERDLVSKDHKVYTYQFLMPEQDTKIKIMETESMYFWNMTKPQQYCWTKYVGPQLIMVNTTNNCYQNILEWWVDGETVAGHPCRKENQQLPENLRIFHHDVCYDYLKNGTGYIQVKQKDGFYKIYCYGNNITINNIEICCPDYVFELPFSESFMIEGVPYELREVQTVVINTNEMHIANQITDQLKINSYKIRTLNTSKLDIEWNKLTNLASNLMNVTLIESPIGNWVFDQLKIVGDTISDFVGRFGTYISIVCGILVVIILFPIIEMLLVCATVGYKMFSLFTSPILRLYTRLRSRWNRRIRGGRSVRRYIRGD